MKSAGDIQSDIDSIVGAHYYSEDFQLLSAFQSYAAGLQPEEQAALADAVFGRLIRDGSLVDIMLCQVVAVPSAVPVLAEKLSNESQTNQITRTLISTLSYYATDEAYIAVERFLDSDQEMDALQALAKIDFSRTLPAIVRRMNKQHNHGMILHLLHHRMKAAGLTALIHELRQSSATRSAGFSGRLGEVLRSKDAAYNPFTADEISAMAAAFP